jgi:hypothetical protein
MKIKASAASFGGAMYGHGKSRGDEGVIRS